jgi:hypothetical protein
MIKKFIIIILIFLSLISSVYAQFNVSSSIQVSPAFQVGSGFISGGTNNSYTGYFNITEPRNTTYTINIIQTILSFTGNDTNPQYNWNILYNGSWLYGSNKTTSSDYTSINYNGTFIFCVNMTTDHFIDYRQIYFSVSLTSSQIFFNAGNLAPLVIGSITISIVCILAMLILLVYRNRENLTVWNFAEIGIAVLIMALLVGYAISLIMSEI